MRFENAYPFGGLKITYLLDVFRPLRKLTGNLIANIFEKKHNIDNREGRWKLQRVSYLVPEYGELWSTHAKNRTGDFTHPPLILYSVHCQASQADRQRTELDQTLPNGSG